MKRSFNREAAQGSVQGASAVEPVTEEPQTTALASLQSIGTPQVPATLDRQESTTPFLGFYEQMGNDDRKAALKQQLGNMTLGDPYLGIGGKFYRANTMAFCLLGAEVMHCWVVFGGDNKEEKVWLTKPAFDTYEGKRVTEIARAVLLALPGSSSLPEDLAPATVVTANFRSAKVGALTALNAAVQQSQTPEFAKANGKLVEVAPCFRVAGTLKITSDVVKGGPNKGRPYAKASMTCAPTTMGQATAIGEWWSAGGAEEYQEAVRLHEFLVKRLRELA